MGTINNKLALSLFIFAFPLLVTTAFSARYGQGELICRRKCQAQQQEDWARCEKLGGGDLPQCQHRSLEEQQLCNAGCLEQYRKDQREDDAREEENIFIFHDKRFVYLVDDLRGAVLVLSGFGDRSDMFREIQNYSLVLFRASPSTFMSPFYRNVDTIAVVTTGRASITLIRLGVKETYNVATGDIIRIRAGTIVHYLNPDDDLELFHMTEINVNNPSYLESFYPSGNKILTGHLDTSSINNQESLYKVFGDKILQAAFNIDKNEARELISERNDYTFFKVLPDDIAALTDKSGDHRQFNTPFNILNQGLSFSNKYGKLYEVNPQDYQQIEDVDIKISRANITKGAMFGPYYNSKSFTIAMVIGGYGYFKIACPLLSQQSGSYNASAALIGGDTFVVPPGHPVVAVASEDKNLEVLYFEINARDNQRIPLAGENNILKQLSNKVMQLSFKMPSERVVSILNKQKESWFFPGPGKNDDRAAL